MKLKIKTANAHIALLLKLTEFRKSVASLPAIEIPEHVLQAARVQGWTCNKQKEGYDTNREVNLFPGAHTNRDRVLGLYAGDGSKRDRFMGREVQGK